nr:hypothetical protein [Tanacetum cinerariifolium]
MNNNKNKQKEGVMDAENEDSAMKIGDNHVGVDDEANGRSGDDDSGSSSEFCAAESEFPSLNELNKQHEDGKCKENNEVGEGSDSRNTENESAPANGVLEHLKDKFHDNQDDRAIQLDNEILNMAIGNLSS